MGVQQIIKMVLGIKPYSFHAPLCDTLFKILLPTTIYRINYGERDKGIAVTSFGLECIPQLLVSALCVLVKHTIEVTDYTDIGTEFTHSTQQSVRMVVFKTSKRPVAYICIAINQHGFPISVKCYCNFQKISYAAGSQSVWRKTYGLHPGSNCYHNQRATDLPLCTSSQSRSYLRRCCYRKRQRTRSGNSVKFCRRIPNRF